MKARALILLVVAAAALAVAGCGGGSGGSGADVASIMPPKASIFVEATVLPTGTMKSDVESLVENVAGIEDPGQLALEEIEKAAAGSKKSFKYTTDVEPWLGEEAGLYLEGYDGDNFAETGIAVETTDTTAAQEFIDKFVTSDSGDEFKEGSFEGADYKVDPEDDVVIGIVGDFVVFAKTEQGFKAMVEASNGEALADQESFTTTIDTASSDSLANLYVDIGGLIKESRGAIDSETELFLESAGIEPKDATALASLVPGSNQVEIDFASDAGTRPPSGDASELLGSLPGGSFAAFASSDFGKRFGEAVDRIDANGIPGSLEPGELKSALSAIGIDLDKLGASISGLGVFAQGNTQNNLTGAAVLDTKNSKEATETVANIGNLLRLTGTPGVTAISGKASGFSVRSPSFGRQPLVVAAEGNRIAISYGLAASAQALTATKGATLAEDPAYKEAVAALGDTPITGFVDGPAALQLFTDVAAHSDKNEKFEAAKPYLEKIAYAGIGAGADGELTTARVIVGFSK